MGRPRSLRDLLVEATARFPDRDLYVWSDGRRSTFSGLVAEVAEVAAGLRDRYGVGKGDRVAVCAANCPEWLLTFWACARLDAVLVAMNGWWTGGEMRNAIDLTRPTLLADGREASRAPRGQATRACPHDRDRARLAVGAGRRARPSFPTSRSPRTTRSS